MSTSDTDTFLDLREILGSLDLGSLDLGSVLGAGESRSDSGTQSLKTSWSVSAGNTTLAATFTQRAAWIQTEYLKLLWNDDIDFFAVYKVRFNLIFNLI